MNASLAELRSHSLGSHSLRPTYLTSGLPLGIEPIDEALPDMGLPRGAVVELASPSGLGRATQLALQACASAQARTRMNSNDGDACWCAWIDAGASLYAPGVVRAGVDLERLLVVRPQPEDIASIAARLTSSSLFSVIVVDRHGVPGAKLPRTRTRWDIAVRRFALAAEKTETTVLLLSHLSPALASPLPVAMRIELTRPDVGQLRLHVAKERRGRVGHPWTVPTRLLA